MESSGDINQVGQDPVSLSRPNRKTKLLALAIATILVASTGALVWDRFFRYWTMEDVGAAVTGDVLAPDFRHSLAGRTITVKGIVTNVSSWQWPSTTLGTLHFVQLDDFKLLHLVYWDQVPFDVGDTVRVRVSFEWSCYNEEAHVYSPQLDFPVICSVLSISTTTYASSLACDIYWTASSSGENVTICFDWIGASISLDECNCSLRAGQHSWTNELIDVFGQWNYGTEMDEIDQISSEDSERGLITFSDNDSDGNLSSGDNLTIGGLSLPESDSGVKCYMILLGCDLDMLMDDAAVGLYLPLTNRGLLTPDFSCGNLVRLNDCPIDAGFEMDVEYSLNNTHWSDTAALISWEFNCSDHCFPGLLHLPSLAEGQDFNADPIWRSEPFLTEGISWVLEIADVNGDGLINVGDSMRMLTDQEELMPSIEVLELTLIYQPNSSQLDHVILVARE